MVSVNRVDIIRGAIPFNLNYKVRISWDIMIDLIE